MGAVPSASAQPCPDVEVVFARGTTEEPGLGPTGEAFVDALRSRIGTKSLEVYPVDYPATTDFPKALDGVRDASARVESMAANCPNTNIVLGGFSQGAAVAGFVTAERDPGRGTRGRPEPDARPTWPSTSPRSPCSESPTSGSCRRSTSREVDVGPLYADKTVELCVPDDFVCSSGRDFNAHTQYVETGMVDQAATFTAARLVTAPPARGDSAGARLRPASRICRRLPVAAAVDHSRRAARTPPQPHLQRAPETIDSCATECRVVGPE